MWEAKRLLWLRGSWLRDLKTLRVFFVCYIAVKQWFSYADSLWLLWLHDRKLIFAPLVLGASRCVHRSGARYFDKVACFATLTTVHWFSQCFMYIKCVLCAYIVCKRDNCPLCHPGFFSVVWNLRYFVSSVPATPELPPGALYSRFRSLICVILFSVRPRYTFSQCVSIKSAWISSFLLPCCSFTARLTEHRVCCVSASSHTMVASFHRDSWTAKGLLQQHVRWTWIRSKLRQSVCVSLGLCYFRVLSHLQPCLRRCVGRPPHAVQTLSLFLPTKLTWSRPSKLKFPLLCLCQMRLKLDRQLFRKGKYFSCCFIPTSLPSSRDCGIC